MNDTPANWEADGWQLVPLNPTDEMIQALISEIPNSAGWPQKYYREAWEKALSASPPFPTRPMIDAHAEKKPTTLETAARKYVLMEAGRCKAAGIFHSVDGYSCTTCGKPVAECDCLPF